jgi:hypothetical protein
MPAASHDVLNVVNGSEDDIGLHARSLGIVVRR